MHMYEECFNKGHWNWLLHLTGSISISWKGMAGWESGNKAGFTGRNTALYNNGRWLWKPSQVWSFGEFRTFMHQTKQVVQSKRLKTDLWIIVCFLTFTHPAKLLMEHRLPKLRSWEDCSPYAALLLFNGFKELQCRLDFFFWVIRLYSCAHNGNVLPLSCHIMRRWDHADVDV